MTVLFIILAVVFTIVVPLFIVVMWELIEDHRLHVKQRSVKLDADIQAKSADLHSRLSAALSRERELRSQLAECHKQLALEEKKHG